MSITRTLNYWMTMGSPFNGEFIGFVNLTDNTGIGLVMGDKVVAPMFLFQNNTGWGDDIPTSNKFSWVLYIKGIDDHSVYMLFGAKEGATQYAMEYITSDTPIDPHNDMYKGRKWCWQN